MTSLWPRIEPLLARVQRPARYIGCEEGSRVAPDGPNRVRWLLVYPDAYEIGLPNQGLQILYEILNERLDALAERSYAPWVDMEAQMRGRGVPLFSLDTHRPAAEFDLIAFNLSAELVYTNVLNCLDLAGVAVRAAERGPADPLVGAGGHCTFNPEPLADFVDFFVIGDGEEAVGEVTECVREWKLGGRTPGSRERVLRELAGIPGVYVPAMYEVVYDGCQVAAVTPRYADVPERVEKRTIADLAAWPYPKRQLVPVTEVVHDRLNVEIFRGCTRGCRFCQAGMVTRPVRERPAAQVRQMVADGLGRTGYDEVSLTSLSSADYSGIEGTVAGIVSTGAVGAGIGDPMCTGQSVGGGLAGSSARGGGGGVAVSLPSLRVDAFTVGLAAQIGQVRRTGLTFAPEAGTWRMRQVINKLIREEDLYGAVESAFSQGWQRVKLYFLTGLPTETDEDTLGIAELARRCVAVGRRHSNRVTVTASVGGFVPKPQTPFQWFGQDTVAELGRKVGLLRDATRRERGVNLRWHDPAATLAEGLASRGDRRMGAVIEEVWRRGGTFQEWSEHFNLALWESAMAAHGLSVDDYVHRHRERSELLPWSHVSAGLHEDFLWGDWQDALALAPVEDCRWTPCYDCGACTGYGVEHVVGSALPPAGGSQGTGQDLTSGGSIPVNVSLTSRVRAGVG
ncbi:MAG: B12-binding domain-containing radical SAM protein [Acidimicrobiales bacterium]|nr:MAG: B12-binding domain-containing radical SAM protein [Acidimicrobiales bacterium]